MASDDSRSLLVPIVIAAMGFIPLALMIPTGDAAPIGTPPAPSTTAIVQVAEPATPAPAEATEIVIETPVPQLTGVSDEIARVLGAQGFANQEQVAGLPESVMAVLMDQKVVLTVAVGGN